MLIVCKSIANSESPVSLSERDGFAAAAPTPGERFLEHQRAHEAQKVVKKDLKKEKKEEIVRKVVYTAVSYCYGCGAPLQTSEVDSPGYVDLMTYDLQWDGGYPGGKQFVSADELREKLSHLRHEKALIVKLVDIVDFNGSFSAAAQKYKPIQSAVSGSTIKEITPSSCLNDEIDCSLYPK